MAEKRTLGELVDEMHDFDRRRKKLEQEIKVINAERMQIALEFMDAVRKQKLGSGSVSGSRASASIRTIRHAKIKSLRKLNKYIIEHDAFDLYQRRINNKAYFDRIENGEAVPGIEIFEHDVVKVTPKKR